MSKESRLAFFKENYDLIFNGYFGKGKKIFIGDKKLNECRFCGKKYPVVKFRTAAHAIPEFLGNRQLILLNECDDCNKFFSENLETHLDKYTRPFRTIAGIQGKEGVPSYRSKDKKTRVAVKNAIEVSTPLESDFFELHESPKELKLNFEKEPYIPAAVYKAFCKIAISIINDPSELSAFKVTIKWLFTLDHSRSPMQPLKILVTFIPGPRPFQKVEVFLLRKKNGIKIMHSIFLIGFGNFFFQLVVPSHLDVSLGENYIVTLPHYPLPFEDHPIYGKAAFGFLDFSSADKKSEKLPISFKYESLIKGIG